MKDHLGGTNRCEKGRKHWDLQSLRASTGAITHPQRTYGDAVWSFEVDKISRRITAEMVGTGGPFAWKDVLEELGSCSRAIRNIDLDAGRSPVVSEHYGAPANGNHLVGVAVDHSGIQVLDHPRARGGAIGDPELVAMDAIIGRKKGALSVVGDPDRPGIAGPTPGPDILDESRSR